MARISLLVSEQPRCFLHGVLRPSCRTQCTTDGPCSNRAALVAPNQLSHPGTASSGCQVPPVGRQLRCTRGRWPDLTSWRPPQRPNASVCLLLRRLLTHSFHHPANPPAHTHVFVVPLAGPCDGPMINHQPSLHHFARTASLCPCAASADSGLSIPRERTPVVDLLLLHHLPVLSQRTTHNHLTPRLYWRCLFSPHQAQHLGRYYVVQPLPLPSPRLATEAAGLPEVQPTTAPRTL